MPTTVEAEIDVAGNIRLLEPVKVNKTVRVIVTLPEEESESKGNAQKVLEFLRNHRLPAESRLTPEQIEAQIEENRNSWD